MLQQAWDTCKLIWGERNLTKGYDWATSVLAWSTELNITRVKAKVVSINLLTLHYFYKSMLYWALLFYNEFEYILKCFTCMLNKLWFSGKCFMKRLRFGKKTSFVKSHDTACRKNENLCKKNAWERTAVRWRVYA